MPWPQDPPQAQESSTIFETMPFYYEPLPYVAIGLMILLVIGLRLWLGHDGDPAWRSKRITEAARKGAARFRQARQQ